MKCIRADCEILASYEILSGDGILLYEIGFCEEHMPGEIINLSAFTVKTIHYEGTIDI